jgi:hypothetical protein
MSRKSLLLAVAIIMVLIGGAGTTLFLLGRHEPSFYLRAAPPPGESRRKASGQFVNKFANLIGSVVDKRQWSEQFTEEQINSYLEEDFLTEHAAERPLPEGISEPRVSFDTDRVQLGFRYGAGTWSSIISLDIHAWLVAKEPNMVGLEFLGMRAGALPISTHSWLERQLDAIRQRDIEASWYRHDGNPVLLLRFQADRSNPTFRLQELSIRPGTITITGHSIESSPRDNLSTALDGK